VGPRAGLGTEAKGKIRSPRPGIELRSPGRPVRSHTSPGIGPRWYPNIKSKVICPATTMQDDKGERKKRSSPFLTWALDGG
jgi:hypothetical protein